MGFALASVVDRLVRCLSFGYHDDRRAATEPTCYAALALAGAGRLDASHRAVGWLAEIQNCDGSIGISGTDRFPQWNTALAALAWHHFDRLTGEAVYESQAQRAAQWLFGVRDSTFPRSPRLGHDTTVHGWPWVDGTHAWVEPTACAVLALRTLGHEQHARVRDGIRLLLDRQLPQGGWNYGNTTVLGQPLVAQVMPTALALLALSGAAAASLVATSVADLRQRLATISGTASFCLAYLALCAHTHVSETTQASTMNRLAAALSGESSPYRLALGVLAALGGRAPLVLTSI